MERPQCDARLERDYIAAGVRVSGLALKARGVGRGDVVAVQLPNIPEFVLGFAIARLGAVMCHSGARLAICMPQAKGMFEGRGVAVSEIDSAQDVDSRSKAQPADPFLLLYTSGTTAVPKGVVHPYRTMLGNARLGAPEHRLTGKSRILAKNIAKNKLPEELVVLAEMPLTPTRKIIRGRLTLH